MTRIKTTLFALIAFLEIPRIACAAPITWKATSNSDLNRASNWSSDAVPGSSDTAIFDSTISQINRSPTASADFSVDSFQFSHAAQPFQFTFSNCTLTFDGTSVLGTNTNPTLTVSNSNNTNTLPYQIHCNQEPSNNLGSATWVSQNIATATGDSGGLSIGVSSGGQFSANGTCTLQSQGSISATNTGTDQSVSFGQNQIAYLTESQISIQAFAQEDFCTISASNSGTFTNDGAATGSPNQIGYVGASSGNSQFHVLEALTAGNSFTLTLQNTGNDQSSGGQANQVGFIYANQASLDSSVFLGNQATFTFSNTGSCLSDGQTSQIGYLGGSQLSCVDSFTALDGLTITATNTGTNTDNFGAPCSGCFIGAQGTGAQLNFQNSFSANNGLTITLSNTGTDTGTGNNNTVGGVQGQLSVGTSTEILNNATITISNNGAGNGSGTGSGSTPITGQVSGHQCSFESDFSAGSSLQLSLSNTGTGSGLGGTGGKNSGYIQGNQINYGTTFAVGDHATVSCTNEGTYQGIYTAAGNNTGGMTSFQLSGSGPFTAGDFLTLTLSNSGNDGSQGTGGNATGFISNTQMQISTVQVGSHATITATNQGTCSNSTTISNNQVGYVGNPQLSISTLFQALDDLTLTGVNQGTDSATGSGSNQVGYIDDPQFEFGTFTVGDRATISVSNSGTSTSSLTTEQVGFISGEQFVVSGPFTAGSNLQITATNSGSTTTVNSNVGHVDSSQIAFDGTFSVGDGAYIKAENLGSGTVNGSQIDFAQGFTITGSATFEAINEGSVTGYGILIEAGTGGNANIKLTGASLYISSGEATCTISSLNGTGTTVQSSPELIINTAQGVSASFTGNIQDYSSPSTLYKTGPGSQTLSGSNSMSGLTTVNQGDLILLGTLGGDVQIDLAGRLLGTASIGGLVTNEGTIAPGQSIGTLTMANYTNATGTYQAEVDGSGHSDLINVTGTANITGGIVDVTAVDGVYRFQTPYTIVHAGTLTGSGYTGALAISPLLVPSLTYDANNIYLTLVTDIGNAAQTFNERAVANQLDAIANPTLQQSILLSEIASLSPAYATAALDSASGWQYTSSLMLAEITSGHFISRLYDAVRSLVTNPNNCCCKTTEEDSCCDQWTIWGEIGYTHTHMTGNRNGHGLSLNGAEGTLGVQTTRCVDWTFGVAGSFEWDTVGYKHRGGKSYNQTLLVGLYSLYRPSLVYGLFDLAYGYRTQTVQRTINIGNLYFIAHSNPHSSQVTGYTEWGVDLKMPYFLLQPFAGIKGGATFESHVGETFAGGWALKVPSRHRAFGASRLGLHFTAQEIPGNIAISLDAAWNYRFPVNKNSMREQFVQFGDALNIRGVNLNQNSFDYAITLSRCVQDLYSFFLEYSGEAYNHALTYDVSAGIAFCW